MESRRGLRVKDYFEIYGDAFPAEHTAAQVDGIVSLLGLDAGARVLSTTTSPSFAPTVRAPSTPPPSACAPFTGSSPSCQGPAWNPWLGTAAWTAVRSTWGVVAWC